MKFSQMEIKLDEIKTLLSGEEKGESTKPKPVAPKNGVWHDAEKLVNVKTPSKVLIVKKPEDNDIARQNHETIENTIITNKIPVMQTHKMKSGDIKLICESKRDRDELKKTWYQCWLNSCDSNCHKCTKGFKTLSNHSWFTAEVYKGWYYQNVSHAK